MRRALGNSLEPRLLAIYNPITASKAFGGASMKTYADLVEALRRLRILDAGQIDRLTRSFGAENPDPRMVAKKLVADSQLTRFQANYLFTGKGNALLVGSYVLLEILGEGGMGTVYKARNWKLGQIVAVKLVRPERLANPAAIRRFQREIRASAKLDHANIVRTIDADEVGGNHLLVMEYVPGARDLHKLIRENGPLPLAQARRYLHRVAVGLQHAFEQGLVHRDIKPQNLLVSSGEAVATAPALMGRRPAESPSSADDTVKILDFGLALFCEGDDSTALTQEGAVMGTIDYVAPEQLQDSHSADIRSDLYSLGCTMYYMLTGQPPFVGGTLMEKMYKHQFDVAIPVEQLRGEIPSELGDIVRKLMAKRPEDRYQTPDELVRDLEALAAGAPPSSSSGVRLKPMALVPVAALAPLEQRDTDSPFAGLDHSDTAVDAPVSIRLHTVPTPARWKHTGLALGIGGSVVVFLIVMVALLLGLKALMHRPVAAPDDGRIVAAPPRKKPADADGNPARDKPDKEADAKPPAVEKTPDPNKGPVAAQELAWKKWLAQESSVRAKREAAAGKSFKLLESRFNDKDISFASFARELAAFKIEHGGTLAAVRGADLLGRLHSPLDDLDAAKLPADASALWRAWRNTGAPGAPPDGPPKELVAVRGDHRGRLWEPVSHVQFIDDKVILSVGATMAIFVATDTREPLAVVSPADLWALSPNGKLFAAGTYDGGLQVYDLEARKSLWNVEVFAGGGVRSLCFSPDSQTLAAGGGLNRAGNGNAGFLVRLLDAATGKSRGTSASLDNQIAPLSYTSDGNTLAAATTNGTLYLLNPRKLQDATPIPSLGGTVQFLLSPDGKSLAAYWYSLKALRLIDVRTRAVVLSVDDLVGDQTMRSLFTRDSSTFAFRESSNSVRLWKLPKTLIRKWDAHVDGPVSTFEFTTDDKELWTASAAVSGVMEVWDVKTGKPLKGPPPYDGAISDLRMSPDGNLVAWVSAGKNIRIWRRDKRTVLSTIHRPEGGPFAFSGDGKRLVTGELHMIRVWDTGTGLEVSPLKRRSPTLPSVAFAPDGRLLLAADVRGGIHCWNFDPAREPDFNQWQFGSNNSTVPRLAFLADGRRFTTFGESHPLHRWSLALDSAIGVAPNSYAACISPNGRFGLTNATLDGHVTIWNLDTAKELGSLETKENPGGVAGPDPRVIDIAVTPDERFALVLQGLARPRLLWLFAMDTGKEVFRFKPGDCARVAISPDGQHILTSDFDGACSLLDLHTGRFVRKIELGTAPVGHAAVFSPDGKLAAVAYASSLILLEMPSGNRIKEWQFPGPVQDVAFAPDGRHLAVANGNGTLYVLRLADAAKK
jgi:serine/threonine protein kinase/WD40 repeat protein